MNATELDTVTTVPVYQCPEPCRTYTEPTDIYCKECGRLLPLRFQRKALPGHTSAETAYVVEDYPYGFRLRCQIRYWIEFKKGHGFRFVSQTSNPKKPGLVWNKPKPSTYSEVSILTIDDNGHVHPCSLGTWPGELVIKAYLSAYGNVLTADGIAACRNLLLWEEAQKHITYEIKPMGTHIINFATGKLELDPTSEGAEHAHEPRQTEDDVRAVWGKALTIAAHNQATR